MVLSTDSGREKELQVVGPPGIEARTEELLNLAFPGLPRRDKEYRRRYTEIDDGVSGELEGLQFEAFEVEHVPSLRCFGYRTRIAGRTLAYSGDAVLCRGLLRLVAQAEVLVLNCSSRGDPVHLASGDPQPSSPRARSNDDVTTSMDQGATAQMPNLLVASDLERSFRRTG